MGDDRYNRIRCLDRFTNLTQKNPAYMSQNPAYFFSNSIEFPQLTLQGCREICGRRWGPYPDNGVRLLNWIIPLLLLLVNISYAAIGVKRFFMVVRVLGDPIGCIWWHLTTLKMWVNSSCKAEIFIGKLHDLNTDCEVRNAVTVVFFAAAKYIRSPGLIHAFDEALKKICDETLSIPERKDRFHTLLIAGSTLAGSQVIDIRRTVFAVVVYIVQVVAVFVPAVGGSPNPSGGRVSPAMLLIWLLPLVLLSNAIGDITSWKHAENVLESFVTDTVDSVDAEKVAADHDDLDMMSRAIIAPWCGLQRAASVTAEETSNIQQVLLAFYAAFPVILAFTIASAVDLTPPTWFSCRAVFNIYSVTAWFSSAGITAYLVSRRSRLGKWIPVLVLIKDFVVGIPILIVVTLSTCGWFNSCYCSSGVIWRRRNARVDLRPDWGYAHNKIVYITSVTVGLALQVFFFAIVVQIYCKVFSVIWSTDREAFQALTRLHLRGFLGENKSNTTDEGASIDPNTAESTASRHRTRSATV